MKDPKLLRFSALSVGWGTFAPSMADTEHTALDVLQSVFGYPAFRGGQAEAVAAAVAGRDTMVLLPTGAGKSLCYQVPAVVAARGGRGTTVVVSPLIALMQDQVAALTGRGVAALALHSHQPDDERNEVLRKFSAGELELLYVSPERAVQPRFKELLGATSIAMVAIDEAHCMSQWGHDFRPEYLRLGELRDVVAAPMLTLTATATPEVIEEIVTVAGLKDPVRVCGDFSRPNLRFGVHEVESDAARQSAVIALLDTAGMRQLSGPGRAIVYCSTRQQTQDLAKALRSRGFSAGYYHAGRTQLARQRAQSAFDLRRTRVLVATNAFGMGVDLPDVRVIVHYQAPGSLAAYYQEAGRAGRDGQPSRCVLLYRADDLEMQRRLSSQQRTSATLEHRNESALSAMEGYATNSQCRQQMLCEHFTGTDNHPRCGLCDVCTGSPAVAPNVTAEYEPTIPAAARRGSDTRRRRPPLRVGILDAYRKRTAKRLGIKPDAVFPKRVAVAIDGIAPTTADELADIPGIDPDHIGPFVYDILDIVRRYDSD